MSEKREKLSKSLKNSEMRDNGNKLWAALSGCQNGGEVFDLMHRVMNDNDIKERISNVSDFDAVNRVDAVKAEFRMKAGTHRGQDFVCAAAQKWCDLTGKNIKNFKMEIAKNDMEKQLQKDGKIQQDVAMLTAWRRSQQVH